MAKMTVNGEAVDYRLDPATPLLWALREASNLTGAKYGCDTRDCGACTVIVDSQAVTSCTVTIGELEGVQVRTIEGLSSGASHPVQQAWIAEMATMCGFCEPGFIMAAVAMIEANPKAGAAEIDALPNVCGCGGYTRIRKAIERAVLESTPTPPPSPPRSQPAAAEPGNSSRFSHGSSAEEQAAGQ